jgi:hypothetical protein
MSVNARQANDNSFWRDVSIGVSDSASLSIVIAAAFTAAGTPAESIFYILLTAMLIWAIVSGFIAYSTLKSLWASYQQSLRLQSDDASMQRAILQKQQFLSSLQLQDDILAATADEIREEVSADASMHWAPPTLQDARIVGIRIALTFILGGIIVILPFLLIEPTFTALMISAAIAIPVIFIMHFIKCRFTGVAPWFGSMSSTFLTALAAAGIYLLIDWIR